MLNACWFLPKILGIQPPIIHCHCEAVGRHVSEGIVRVTIHHSISMILNMHIYIYICTYTYVYIYIHTYVYMYICLCIYIYTHIIHAFDWNVTRRNMIRIRYHVRTELSQYIWVIQTCDKSVDSKINLAESLLMHGHSICFWFFHKYFYIYIYHYIYIVCIYIYTYYKYI